jgi:hypothetical protein
VFTPSDTTHYENATAQVAVTVKSAPTANNFKTLQDTINMANGRLALTTSVIPQTAAGFDSGKIYISQASGKDIYAGYTYTTPAAVTRLQAAVQRAQAVLDNPASTDAQAKSAAATLNSAINSFNSSCRTTGGRIDAASVSLNYSNYELAPGKSLSLKATTDPVRTTEKVLWSSSNPDITVSTSGRVTVSAGAQANETAVITAATSVTGKKASCTIKVIIPTSSLVITDEAGARLSKATITYNGAPETRSVQLYARATEGHTDSLTWSSSEGSGGNLVSYEYHSIASGGSLCTVTSTGSGGGRVTMTVRSGSGKSARCAVTIGGAADSLNVTESRYVVASGGNLSYDVTATAGRSLTLKAVPVCRDGVTRPIDKNVVWSIQSITDSGWNSTGEDPADYITVSAKGAVKGLQPCHAIIQAAAEAGSEDCRPVTFYVTVYPVLKSIGFANEGEKITGFVIGSQEQFALNDYLNVVWSDYGSHDGYYTAAYELVSGDVLSVDYNGVITPAEGAYGKAKIKVTVTSGTQVKTMTIPIVVWDSDI